MHPDQIDVAVTTVRALVAEQFPRWRQLPVRRLTTSGTVNAIFRIGDSLAARFPLRPDVSRRTLEREAAAARELLGRTRFPTPAPVALGAPGHGYPMSWSVQTWLPGTPATDDFGGSTPFALDLAEFIGGVRAIPTHGRTFTGPGRGGELPSHDAWVARCIEESKAMMDADELRRLWARFRSLPPARHVVMNHGDLIPGNVLVAGGRLVGVLDVGGLKAADPALDLVCAWHLLGPEPRAALRAELGCDDLEWERGKAWAFEQAMGLVWYYLESNPPMSRMGRRTLDRIRADG
jgi:aminoglycoside phosphotransferase (APT) family kinase protein